MRINNNKEDREQQSKQTYWEHPSHHDVVVDANLFLRQKMRKKMKNTRH
jgi:hypothetical protein